MFPPDELELAEQLESFSPPINDLVLLVHETDMEVVGIDLPEHFEEAGVH